MKCLLIPKIRFKGFTNDWEQRKVKDIFKVTRGHVLAATKTAREKTEFTPYPVYSSQTAYQGLMGYYNDYLYSDAITWTTDGANAGTVNYRKGKFYCTNVCGVLISEEGYANKMISEALNKVAWKHVSKVGNPKLMNNVMSEIVISIPRNMKEQSAISNFFNSLDNLITLHQRKLDKLKNLKKAYLNKIFPAGGKRKPELRFKGFTDDWEQRKLGDIVERVIRKNKNLESNLPLTISAQFGLIDQNDFFDKRIASKNLSGYLLLKKCEFAYNKSTSNDAPWGAIKRLDNYNNGALSTLYIAFKIKDNNLDSDFLAKYYDTDLWHKDIRKVAAEGARNHGLLNIAPEDFFDTTLLIPKNYREQKLIGKIIGYINNLITLHQRKAECVRKLKFSILIFLMEGDK